MSSMPVRLPKLAGLALFILLFAGCATEMGRTCPPCPPCPPCPQEAGTALPEKVEKITPEIPETGRLKVPAPVPSAWSQVEGWDQDDPALALEAFLNSCLSLRRHQEWKGVCEEAESLTAVSEKETRDFFEKRFLPYQMLDTGNDPVGLVTGYYLPDLHGSREPSPEYPYPLYGRPSDLLVIDLGDVYPELANYRLRGRVASRRILPYWDRSEIQSDRNPLEGEELLWVDDPVELFFLHIQGSGRILFEDGSWTIVNYADQNGHPYRSVSEWLIKNKIMTRDQMSMQNIKAWAQENPLQVDDLLNTNPSFVFFRELPEGAKGVPGALGVPLTPERSAAVDPRYIPLGAPVFLATTWPNSDRPLHRLMMAQDTGGAIKGPVRADFFWGMGDEAGREAGRMKQPLKLWVLLPVAEPASAGQAPAAAAGLKDLF